MVSGGLPSLQRGGAGRQLGPYDPCDLSGHGLRVVEAVRPAAVTRLIGALLREQNDEWAVQRAR